MPRAVIYENDKSVGTYVPIVNTIYDVVICSCGDLRESCLAFPLAYGEVRFRGDYSFYIMNDGRRRVTGKFINNFKGLKNDREKIIAEQLKFLCRKEIVKNHFPKRFCLHEERKKDQLKIIILQFI